MRLHEVAVQSSWIRSVSYNRPNRVLTLVTHAGRKYIIQGVSRTFFDRWKNAPSKGKHFHQVVKYNHILKRI